MANGWFGWAELIDSMTEEQRAKLEAMMGAIELIPISDEERRIDIKPAYETYEEKYADNPHEDLPPRSDLLWLCIDLDGTLAEPVWTPANPTAEIGNPIWRNVVKLFDAVQLGYKVIIHTSRGDTDYERIEAWLNHYQIPFKEIRTGKPLAALYIDDRGRHAEDSSWIPERKN